VTAHAAATNASSPLRESIREALPADAAALTWLQALARNALIGVRGGDTLLAEEPPVNDWVARLGEPGWVFVGCLDDIVFAYIEGVMSSSSVVYVRQVFVHPEARELGLGDGMLATLCEAARAAGVQRVEGAALPGDRDTKNLYERASITARKLIVSAQL
jgi:GNAT superfamily N-acetyltransferase